MLFQGDVKEEDVFYNFGVDSSKAYFPTAYQYVKAI